MDWEIALRRQALAEWRDRQILSINAGFNTRAAEGLAGFDSQVTEANLIDSVWDPAGFADRRIDDLMRASVPAMVTGFVELAAAELRAISAEFGPVADALARAGTLDMPDAGETVDADVPPGLGQEAPVEVPATPSWRIAGLPGVRHALGAGQWAAEGLISAGLVAERALQDRAGFYDRLRAAALARIATRWMGSAGEPRPVLQQVVDLIDGAAAEARISMI